MRLLYLRLTLIVLVLCFAVPIVYGATITVDDDDAQITADYNTIQEAIDAATAGDTIEVYIGTYTENILVDKQLILVGIPDAALKPTINANDANHAIRLESNDCTVQGFNILGANNVGALDPVDYYAGIFAGRSTFLGMIGTSGHTISDNDIHDNGHGIYLLTSSDNNQISGNSIYNSGYGIWAYQSDGNTIQLNDVYDNANGVVLEGSSNNLIDQCSFSGHGAAAGIGNAVWMIEYSSVVSVSSTFNTVSDCTFDDDGIRLGSNTEDSTISGCTFSVDTAVLAYNFRCIATQSGCTRITIEDNTVTGTLLQTLYDHAAFSITYSDDIDLVGNSISLMYRGIDIHHCSNIYMRNNILTNNYYNFHFDVDMGYTSSHFTHDIDDTNTVDGKKIHWIDGSTSITVDLVGYPDIGYLALINCDDVLVDGVSLDENSQGILLYNTINTVISGGSFDNNRLAGIELYSCTGITVQNTALQNNGNEDAVDDMETGRGVYLYDTDDSTITGCTISNNWRTGVHLAASEGNTVSDSDILDNGLDGATEQGTGVKVTNTATGNTVHSNQIKSTVGGRQKYGVWSDCIGNTYYNNYFDQTIDAYASADAENWDVTPVSGSNIIGGSYLGGNYWDDYTGGDNTHDGLGDTDIPWVSGGNIVHGGDNHPLTSNTLPDSIAPTIVLTSPQDGATYTSSNVALKVSSPDLDVDHWWYNLDGGADVIFTPDTTIPGLSDGSHTVVIHVIDTSTNENQEIVTFTVDKPSSGGGYVPPPPLKPIPVEESEFTIGITSPSERYTTSRSITLRYNAPNSLSRVSYCLDGGDSIRFSSSTEISRLTVGLHSIVVTGQDYSGRVGQGEFEFEVLPVPLSQDTLAGTPDFPDDVSFSFSGKPQDYVLSYEAKSIGNNEVMICLNQVLEGSLPGDSEINDLRPNGTCLGYIPKTVQWDRFNITVPSQLIVPDVTNYISFIHDSNPDRYSSLADWSIRNVELSPVVEVDFPQVSIQFKEKSVSSSSDVEPLIDISGVTSPELYDLYVYMLGPEGVPKYYPSWSITPQPLDDYYLETNYYGELDRGYLFNVSGSMYTIVAKITYQGSLEPVALSMDSLYYCNTSSISLQLNSGMFKLDDTIRVGYSLTAGDTLMNCSTLASIENPRGEITYLPMGTSSMSSTYYEPISDDYVSLIDDIVSAVWEEGSYILRARLFDENGTLIGEDLEVFKVSNLYGRVEGLLFTAASFEVTDLRLRFFDARTLELVEEYMHSGSSRSYSIDLPVGKYFVTGEIIGGQLNYQTQTREYGTVYPVPFSRVEVIAGETSTLNIMSYTEWGVVQPVLTPTSTGDIALFSDLVYTPGTEKITLVQDKRCPNPKVFINSKIMSGVLDDLLREFPGDDQSTLNRFYCLKLQERLAGMSSNVDFSSYGELLDALSAQEKLLLENPGNELNLEFAQSLNAEYLTSLSIGNVGDVYLVSISVMDLDLSRIVARVSVEGGSIDEAFNAAVSGIGDLGQVIRDWERAHPVPPRRAHLQVAVDPETISPEEGKNSANLNIRVTNCAGEPVKGTKVYLDYITDRGYVVAQHQGVGGLGSYVYGVTDDDGYVTAKYTLNKGLYAGEDHIDLFTVERGSRRVTGRADLTITGLKMQITPVNQSLAPFETTLVHVDVFSVDENGEETPVEGAAILIERSYLGGNKMIPLGALNEDSMPVTGANGRATFRFVAAEKEGIVDIPARYQALGYDMSIREVAQVEIKSEQYLIKIEWTETLNQWTVDYGTQHLGDWYSGGAQDTLTELQRTQKYSLSVETTWDQRSGREETDARVVYLEDWVRDDWAKTWWVECHEWDDQGVVSSTAYAQTESGVGGGVVDIVGGLSDFVTINTKLKTDAGKNIYLYCNPVRVSIPLYGDYEYGYDVSTVLEGDYRHRDDRDFEPDFVVMDTSTDTVSASHDYNGEGYNPDPRYWAEKVKSTGNPLSRGGSLYRGSGYEPVVYLRRTGKNTYEGFSYEYNEQRNGYLYTTSGVFPPGTHSRGEYYWRLNLLIDGEWVEVDFDPYTIYNTWEYSRKFSITVVRK